MTELTHLWPQLLHGLHLVLAAAAILAVLPIARHFFFSMVTLARSPKRTPDAVPRTRFVVMIPASSLLMGWDFWRQLRVNKTNHAK